MRRCAAIPKITEHASIISIVSGIYPNFHWISSSCCHIDGNTIGRRLVTNRFLCGINVRWVHQVLIWMSGILSYLQSLSTNESFSKTVFQFQNTKSVLVFARAVSVLSKKIQKIFAFTELHTLKSRIMFFCANRQHFCIFTWNEFGLYLGVDSFIKWVIWWQMWWIDGFRRIL